tara:strand:+ start:895 stop:1809 length:915 start_codon:yes stop_codon:yes gene_type:complete
MSESIVIAIFDKLQFDNFSSFGFFRDGDNMIQYNKNTLGGSHIYIYNGYVFENQVDQYINRIDSIDNDFNNFINSQNTVFEFKKMDLNYFQEIIKNKEGSLINDLSHHFRSGIREEDINDFYEKYDIYVTPFRFLYCKKNDINDNDQNLYFMSQTTTALINENLYPQSNISPSNSMLNMSSSVFTPPRQNISNLPTSLNSLSTISDRSPIPTIPFPGMGMDDSPISGVSRDGPDNFRNRLSGSENSGMSLFGSEFDGGKKSKKVKKSNKSKRSKKSKKSKKSKRKSNQHLKKVGPKRRSICKKK